MKKKPKIILGFFLVAATTLIQIKTAEAIWGVSADGQLLGPDWLSFPILAIDFIVTFLGIKAVTVFSHFFKQRRLQKDFDDLSEVEKWEHEKVNYTISSEINTDLLFAAENFAKKNCYLSAFDLQREFHIEYECACTLINQLETIGVVAPFSGTLERTVLTYEEST